MTIDLPAIPAGVLTLLAFFAPYAVAIINEPRWPAAWKKAVAIIVALALALVVLGFYVWMTGDVPASWPVLILLTLVVMQASYAMVTKPTATAIEEKTAHPLG